MTYLDPKTFLPSFYHKMYGNNIKFTGIDSQEDEDNKESLNERRIRNLENYNHNLASQMISLLSSMNDNIQSLASKLKDRGFTVEEAGQNREKAKLDDDKATISTFTNMDQGMEKV